MGAFRAEVNRSIERYKANKGIEHGAWSTLGLDGPLFGAYRVRPMGYRA